MNNQYPANLTYDIDIVNNNIHEKYISQGRNSHNSQNKNQYIKTNT